MTWNAITSVDFLRSLLALLALAMVGTAGWLYNQCADLKIKRTGPEL